MATMSFEQYARLMQQRADSMRKDMADATRKATDLVHAESKRIMNVDIYSKPEDRTGMSWKDRAAGVGYTHTTDLAGKVRRRKVEHIGKQLVAFGIEDGETVVGGKKKWTRTGALRNSEKSKMIDTYTGEVFNDVGYALPRHNLGYGPASPEAIDPKPKKSKNTTRQAPFRTEAIAATAQRRFEVYREAMRMVLFR